MNYLSNPHSQYEKSSGPVDRLATEELEAYLNVRNESIDYWILTELSLSLSHVVFTGPASVLVCSIVYTI